LQPSRRPLSYNDLGSSFPGGMDVAKLHFEGDQDYSQAPPELWARLSDPSFLVRCLPDVESVSQAEVDRAVCTVRPKLAFMRGTLDVTVRVVEASEPFAVRLAIHSKGIASESHVEVALHLERKDSGSRMHWTADVNSLGGLLKALPQGLIRGTADRLIGELLSSIRERLNESPGSK
jgi:carbon monoxide dehydrogenase subunit G